MNKKNLLKWITITGIVILMGLSLGTIGYMYTEVNTFENVFANNLYIEDLAIGGLTKEEARAKLEQNITDIMSTQSLVFTKGNTSVEIPFKDLGITYNINETIDLAFEIGRNEGFFKKYQISKNGVDEIQKFQLTKTIDEEKIRAQLETSAKHFYIEPINATLERQNRQFMVTKEKNGEALDIDATMEKVLNILADTAHLEEPKINVEVVVQTVVPECTEESLQDVQTLLASFSTSYDNSSFNRNENLKVAAKKITRMLLPDEIFYLSNQLEPFTEAAGYKDAGTIVGGKIIDSLGGGICQVSSTLYNAILLTDIEVVKRQNHSLAVSYVPLGRDATYSTGLIDFQFKNNTGYPLFIEGYCENNQVIVNIYGHKSFKSEYDIKFESKVTEVIPAPATKYEEDSSLAEGKEVVEVTALDGKRVNLYKLYYKNGALEKKVLVNNSYYRPRAAVIRRGPKASTPVATPSDQPKAAHTPSKNNTTNEPEHTSTPTPPSETPSPSLTPPPLDSNQADTTNDFLIIQE